MRIEETLNIFDATHSRVSCLVSFYKIVKLHSIKYYTVPHTLLYLLQTANAAVTTSTTDKQN